MATPSKTRASGATAASASVAMVSPEDANAHKQHHFVAYPSVHNAHMDVAGHTSLHRAIYSIALQASTASSAAAAPSSSSPTLSSSPKQMMDWILSTTEGRRSTSVRCRRGGWTPLHLCCRLVVIPEDIILALVDCNPSAIAIPDDDGENCIHLACRYGLSEAIIERLITLSPQSTFVARDEENGEIPLHAAIHHSSSPDVLNALVSASPESVRSCNDNGQSALHLACEYERHDFIKMAVKSMMTDKQNARAFMGQIIQADEMGSTPISILWSSFVESFGGSVEDPQCTWFDATNNTMESQEQAATWSSLVTLMTTAFTDSAVKKSSDDGHTLLRSAIGLGADAVPASLFQYVVSRYPSALQKANNNGQLPLHEVILASSKPRRRVGDEASVFSPDQRDDDEQEYYGAEYDDHESRTGKPSSEDDEKKSQHESSDDASLSAPSSFDEIQDILVAMRPPPVLVVLDAYPRAASIPCGDGRLALHLAIEAQISWNGGLSKIFDAAPASLRVPDPKNGLLPFLHAATSGATCRPSSGKKDSDSINTIFQLLRLGPDLIGPCDAEEQKRKASGSVESVRPSKRARV